jgi:hypothetical protein
VSVPRFATLLLLLLLPAQARLEAQEPPLEAFVQQVARLWAAGDVGALVDLIPADNRLLLDTGSGTEVANSRHAAAALRALFGEWETLSLRPVRVTYASTLPARGFGELAWVVRPRAGPGEQTRSVYVAAVRETRGWRVSELRIMP